MNDPETPIAESEDAVVSDIDAACVCAEATVSAVDDVSAIDVETLTELLSEVVLESNIDEPETAVNESLVVVESLTVADCVCAVDVESLDDEVSDCVIPIVTCCVSELDCVSVIDAVATETAEIESFVATESVIDAVCDDTALAASDDDAVSEILSLYVVPPAAYTAESELDVVSDTAADWTNDADIVSEAVTTSDIDVDKFNESAKSDETMLSDSDADNILPELGNDAIGPSDIGLKPNGIYFTNR